MAGQPYAAGGIRSHGRRDPRGDRRRAARRTRAASSPSCARSGDDHVRDQVRLRPDRRTTRRGRCGSPREVTRRGHLPRRARRARRVRRPTATTTSTLVAGAMLDACAPHARWIDVFCDRGAFDADQARDDPRAPAWPAAAAAGPRQPAAARATACRSRSSWARRPPTTARTSTDDDVDALAGSDTVATLLPGAEFSTRSPYPDARRLIDAGVTVALATDCNPGSSFTTSMPFCIAVAVRDMRMTPAEAVWSATAGGARALRRDDVGRIASGARARPRRASTPRSHLHLAYRPGVDLVDRVWRRRVHSSYPASTSMSEHLMISRRPPRRPRRARSTTSSPSRAATRGSS